MNRRYRMKRLKRIISILLIAAIIIPLMPIGEIKSYAAEANVAKIEVARTMEELGEQGRYTVLIHGSELNKAEISYKKSGSPEYIPMPQQLPGSGNTLKQYQMDSGITITHIRVDTMEFRILEDNMPEIQRVVDSNGMDTKQFDLNGDEESIEIYGLNFDKIKTEIIEGIETKTTITIGNKTADTYFIYGSPVTLDRETLRSFGTGRKNVLVERKSRVNGVDIQISYLQNNVIRIYQSININIEDDITIYPNRGKVGSPVEITIRNKKEQYSVFFKEKDEDLYKVGIMGEEPIYPLITDGKTIIRLKVPKGLETGKMYKLYITNNLDKEAKGKNKDYDLTSLITMEKYIGEFYVVDATTGPYIDKIVPNEGSSDGSYVSIYGARLEELKIPELLIKNNEVNTQNLSIPPVGLDEPTKLRIKYNTDNETTYKTKEVAEITRDFLVTIGRDAIFETEHLNKQNFQFGDSKEDMLYVKTNTISQDDLKDPVKDVVVLITTTIKMKDGEEYIFTELAIKEKGYKFLVSSQDPQINTVTPSQIQVNSINDTSTKNDMIISIQGEKFNVFRYEDGNTIKTNYPKVVIGGINESNAQLIIERNSDNTIKYYNKRGEELVISEESKGNIIFEVLDKAGNIVDGVGKNQEGTSIVLTIPKSILVDKDIIGSRLPIAIANPKRDTNDRRTYYYRNDMISFIVAEPSPSIESVEPWRVTTLGGEDVVVTGNGFLDGIKVYINGVEVQGVKREIDKLTTKGKLTFKAPKGLEGRTILMVQNPDGGSDTHEFIYIQTENIDPKLTSVIPNSGTEDDIIILRGDNFLKPDPTINNLSGIGIDKLIGTIVKIDGVDVNEYNAGKALLDYSAPKEITESLINKVENPLLGITELKLGKAYKNSIIKSGSNIYTIRKNREGTMDIAGEDNIYNFFLEDDKIKAIDGNGVEYEAVIGKDRIILKSATIEKVFDISYDFDLFSISENERGTKSLKLADYYNSIYLRDNNNSKYFVVTKDEKDRIVLTDGRNENYEVKIIGEKIYAGNYELTVNNDGISFNGRTLNFQTPYKVEGNIIVGHRVEIIDRGEIEVRVPKKEIPKKYDVTVTNPDTKSSTIKLGFEYLMSAEQPEIHYIEPPEGSIDGGYIITIGGARFDKDTKVLIDGVPATNVVVDQTTYSSLKAKVPKYRGTENDFVAQKKFVRVHVITRTGQASTKEMFAYKLTSSNPQIRLLDTKGSTAGGSIIRIVGKDIRFYEPYTGNPPTSASIPGVDYEDLDGDRKWTNILSDKQKEAQPVPLVPPTKDYDKYLSSPVLPVIQFGNNQAKIVEFTKNGDEYFIQVVLPESNIIGAVDVTLSNNDRAPSNVVKFTYEASKPTIKSIVPSNGRRGGGEKRDILAEGYMPSKIKLIGANGREIETTMNLIRFGENSNKNINIDDDEAGGRIRNGNATVNLQASGLKAELKNYQLTLTLTVGDEEYTGTYPLENGAIKYINIGSLKEKTSKKSYAGHELVKVSILKDIGRLEIERGFATSVKETTKGVLETIIPSYYKIGSVDVALVNKDGESNKVKFEYTNPGSQPKVTNILRDDDIPPKLGSDGKERIQQINAKGGSLIKVIGSDFRDKPNPTIIIGNNDMVIPSSAVTFVSDKELTFIMPAVTNTSLEGKLLKLTVQNDDKGTGQSTDNVPPIYVQIIFGETNPATGNIDPDRGPVSGGTQVTITGTDFREVVDGFNGEFEIYFGNNKVKKEDIISFTYNKIVLRTPKGDKPGIVPVKIINPDGTPTGGNIFFTYISEPKIFDVNPKTIFINDDKTEITIIGEMFMEGARVLINEAEALEVKFIDDKTLKVRFPQVDKAQKVSIKVINPDGGVSNEFTDFRYELPLPLKPMVLEGIPGYESTVILIWNKSDPDLLNRATDYEIYGRKTKDSANTFVGTTSGAEYLVKGLEPNTEYTFMVRALNEYGAAIDFATVTVKTLSVQEDYKQKEKEDKLKEDQKNIELKGKETIEGNKVIRTLGSDDIKNGLGFIDFTLTKYKGANEYIIKIPLALARTDSTLNIKDGTMTMTINPKDMYTYKVSTMDEGDKDSNLQIVIKKGRETNIPRGKKVASILYDIDFLFQRGKDTISIDKLLRSGKLTLDLDTLLYTNTKNVYLGVFNISTGTYEKAGEARTVSFNQKGKYLLISDK
jgi:hypothetical protein